MNNNDELKQANFLSVSALNSYLSYRFDNDKNLQTVYLEGELSNFKYSGRHMYFSIKDENSEISGMMFYPLNQYLDFTPEDGMLVQMVGKVGIYEKRGTYSIVVKKMIRAGVGLLYQQFLDLKEKLGKEGLFDEEHKLNLPEYPNTIGVITSPTGEAINDITSTIGKRYPLAKIILYPASVQGSDAPLDLVRALKEAYQNKDIDVLIIGRGGGSFEDLACFNDETLARTLYDAPFPTISAVGHEGDYTIVDFVASKRAPTPTGAAMLCVKNRVDIIENIDINIQRLKSGFRTYLSILENNLNKLEKSYALSKFDFLLDQKANQVDVLKSKLEKNSPLNIINASLEKVNHLKISLNNNYSTYLTDLEHSFKNNINKLIILNPLNLMDKGYSVVFNENNVISSVKMVDIDDEVDIRMKDGKLKARITNISEDNNGR